MTNMNSNTTISKAFIAHNTNAINKYIILHEATENTYSIVFYEGLLNLLMLQSINNIKDKARILEENLSIYVRVFTNCTGLRQHEVVLSTVCYDKQEFEFEIIEMLESNTTIEGLFAAIYKYIITENSRFYTLILNDTFALLCYQYYKYNKNINIFNDIINFVNSNNDLLEYTPKVFNTKNIAVDYLLNADALKLNINSFNKVLDIHYVIALHFKQKVYSLEDSKIIIENNRVVAPAPFFYTFIDNKFEKVYLEPSHTESVFYLGYVSYNEITYDLFSTCTLDIKNLIGTKKNALLINDNLMSNLIINKRLKNE